MTDPVFRTATRDEVDQIIELDAAEGWNPGLDDAEGFYAADPEGFFVAEIDGRLAANISVVNHNGDYSYVGLYICRPEFRGMGIGFSLWNHALAHAGNRSLGLDGVEEQQANYAKQGFVTVAQSVRFKGPLEAGSDPAIRPMRDRDTDALVAADAAANGFERKAFMSNWVRPIESRRTMVLDGGEGCAGFATIRACESGVKLGPIIAPDAEAAIALVRACLTAIPCEQVIIDCFEDNQAMIGILKGKGFAEIFRCGRMYRGTPPVPGASSQGLATLELG